MQPLFLPFPTPSASHFLPVSHREVMLSLWLPGLSLRTVCVPGEERDRRGGCSKASGEKWALESKGWEFESWLCQLVSHVTFGQLSILPNPLQKKKKGEGVAAEEAPSSPVWWGW